MQCCSAVRATCRNYKARKTRTLNGGEGGGVWGVCSPKLPHLRKMSPPDHRLTSHWNTSQGFCACLIPRLRLPLWKFSRKGRREGECGRGSASPLIFLLPKVPCASSLVIRVSLAFSFRVCLCAEKEELEEETAPGAICWKIVYRSVSPKLSWKTLSSFYK